MPTLLVASLGQVVALQPVFRWQVRPVLLVDVAIAAVVAVNEKAVDRRFDSPLVAVSAGAQCLVSVGITKPDQHVGKLVKRNGELPKSLLWRHPACPANNTLLNTAMMVAPMNDQTAQAVRAAPLE